MAEYFIIWFLGFITGFFVFRGIISLINLIFLSSLDGPLFLILGLIAGFIGGIILVLIEHGKNKNKTG